MSILPRIQPINYTKRLGGEIPKKKWRLQLEGAVIELHRIIRRCGDTLTTLSPSHGNQPIKHLRRRRIDQSGGWVAVTSLLSANQGLDGRLSRMQDSEIILCPTNCDYLTQLGNL